jgi:hypothetical protein
VTACGATGPLTGTPRSERNLTSTRKRKSPLQTIDQPLESLPLSFFAAHHAASATSAVYGATGFSDGDRTPVLVDPTVKLPTLLDEHTQKVVRLAGIRIRSWRGGQAIGLLGRPVQRDGRGEVDFVSLD